VKGEQRKPLAVGDMVHGFCQGFFGRDHYDCMQIVETGPDWVLLQAVRKDGGLHTYEIEGFSSVHNTRVEGFSDLVRLMELRDVQAEKGCEYDANLDNWGEGDGCHFRGAVRLTKNGPFIIPGRRLE
jgi:hypothetical protein